MTPVWTPRALEDLSAIFEHIADENPDAAARLRDDVLAIVEERLPSHPHIGRPGRVGDTREYVVRPSSILVYRLRSERIEILAFRPVARSWPERF